MTEPIIAEREVTRHILSRFGIRLQKKLGQHFLTDESVVRRIAAALQLSPGDAVLEIGPGIGTLTQMLAMTGAQVTAVELDRRFIDILGKTLAAYGNVRLVQGDVLAVDMREFVASERFCIAGNLPYYITTPIVMKFLEEKLPAERMVFMVQKEVADRMVALPGKKDYGALSVAVRYYMEPAKLFEVPAAAFLPPPAVDSAVVLLTRRQQSPVDIPSEKVFFQLVKAAFAQRRKTLANSLRGSGLESEFTAAILAEAGIDGNRRGETLSLVEFASLCRAYCQKRGEAS